MKYSHGWELLHNAVHILCSHGSQRERLIHAVCELNNLNLNNLPSDLQRDFKGFMDDMVAQPSSGKEGAITTTINSFNDAKIQKAVDSIVSFYDSICRYREPSI